MSAGALATVLYYGPDPKRATLAVIIIQHDPEGPPVAEQSWRADSGDIRHDSALADEMIAFIRLHGATRTVFGAELWGCEHAAEPGGPAEGGCGDCPGWTE